MCLILFAYRAHPDYPLILAANRDEFYARPALPLGWWQVKKLDQEIAACEQTVAAARRPGGLIEEIGQLQRKVEVVVQNKRSMSDSIKDPRTYFQGQLLQSGSQLKVNDFSLQDARPEQTTLPSKQPVTDYVIAIDWPNKKDLPVGLDVVEPPYMAP